MFKFPLRHRPSMLFDTKKRNRFERIVKFVASVYAPMFLRVHLKPRASNGTKNAIKKCFLKHATAWLNPTNVAVSVFCDNPSFPLSTVLATEQYLPSQVHTHEMLWM